MGDRVPPVPNLRALAGVAAAPHPKVRVVLADDQELVRAGLRMVLENQPDIEVVGEVPTGEMAVELVQQLEPDVVLMDVRMPGIGGIEATERITRTPGNRSKVLMVSSYDHDEVVYSSIRAGAAGFLAKSVNTAELINAVRVVAADGGHLTPDITRRVLTHIAAQPVATDPTEGPLRELSEREVEVLRLVGLGLSNDEICERLVIGEPTVKSHVSNILRKLGLRDRVKAVVMAFEVGLIHPGDTP